jgi:CheY-like chemotaxis protein
MSDRFGYPDLAGKSLLVVDDHQDSLDFLEQLLHFCGAEVLTAWSTAHARGHLRACSPSLIVCDFQMPRETGVQFMRWLREQPGELGGTPALAITAYSAELHRAQDHSLAFDGVFVKPLDVPRFLRTVGAIVTRPRLAASHARHA